MKITNLGRYYKNYTHTYKKQNLSNDILNNVKNSKHFELPIDENKKDSSAGYNSLDIYVKSAQVYNKADRKEQAELAQKIQLGGEEGEKAKVRLINANLMLVVDRALSRLERANKLDIMDYIQEGNRGLIAAVEKYDGHYAFSSFAVPYIDGYLKIAENNQSDLIRVPRYLNKFIKKVLSAQISLRAKLNREPTINEVAKQTHLSVMQVEKCLNAKIPVESLSKKISEDTELIELTENKNAQTPEKDIDKKEKEQYIRMLLGKLNERAQQILIYKFGLFGNEPLNQGELAAKYNLTPQRVSAIVQSSLEILKRRAPAIEEYL